MVYGIVLPTLCPILTIYYCFTKEATQQTIPQLPSPRMPRPHRYRNWWQWPCAALDARPVSPCADFPGQMGLDGADEEFLYRFLGWFKRISWGFNGDLMWFNGDLMRFHEGLMGFMGYGDSHQYSVHWVLKWWEMGIAWWFRSGLSDFYLGLWCQTELSTSTSSSRNTSITKVNNKRIFLPLSKYNSI